METSFSDSALLAPFSCFFGSFYCIFGIIWIFGLIIGLIGVIFWVFMLIDVIRREEKDFPDKGKDQKILWLLLVILTGWIGSLVYYFMVYRKAANSK